MKQEKFVVRRIVLGIICLIWILPVLAVAVNAFKMNTYVKTETFALPNAQSSAGFDNFIKGMTFGNYPFLKSALYSVVVTVLSVGAILLFTSMAAWYIARVDSKACRVIYYLCVFSMVVPFQMVMLTLSGRKMAMSSSTMATVDTTVIWSEVLTLPEMALDEARPTSIMSQ